MCQIQVEGKELGKDTPKSNGYSFVSAPSPVPGVDASPFMTWGEVDGTPIQLDGNQTPLLKRHTPGPSYRILKVPNRDRLGHMLAEQVSLRQTRMFTAIKINTVTQKLASNIG
ncbi:splicing factor ESS-2 homolog isoform X4 [Palaemon carinicauda]|uniref:splicing factor ESS-2 homolog isoform X2 n=1 Tax=Palaemon carinicauda TaxID=392227 RepID=UPI0035B61CF4